MENTDLGQDENHECCEHVEEAKLHANILAQALNEKPETLGPKALYIKTLAANLAKNVSLSFQSFFDGLSDMYGKYYQDQVRHQEQESMQLDLKLLENSGCDDNCECRDESNYVGGYIYHEPEPEQQSVEVDIEKDDKWAEWLANYESKNDFLDEYWKAQQKDDSGE